MLRELRQKRATLIAEARQILDKATKEGRDLDEPEKNAYDGKLAEAERLLNQAEREERQLELEAGLAATGRAGKDERAKAPAFNRTSLGDDEVRAIAHWTRTGDVGAVSHLRNGDGEIVLTLPRELRASNDAAMNITTAADGGNIIPTGFVADIAARKAEIMLANKLGVRRIPGSGTTVSYPYDNADANDFVSTSEQVDAHTNTYDRDAPALGKKNFTLVKYTKKVELTEELLDDEPGALMAFLGDTIGRSIATTHNALLLTEIASNGTSLKTFASASAIAAGEPDALIFNNTLSYYLDDGGSIGWVMRPATFGAIAGLTGSARLYAETPGGSFRRQLLGYNVEYSNKAAAIGASAKSLFFGNWYYVGMREDPQLRLLRDPYSVDGMVILKYSFRAVYGVLIAGAVGYGVHPSA